MNYAFITGASKGIGRAIAIELAQRNNNLLLTARSEDLLKALAADIQREYEVTVQFKACDLTDSEVPAELSKWCRSNEYSVSALY